MSRPSFRRASPARIVSILLLPLLAAIASCSKADPAEAKGPAPAPPTVVVRQVRQVDVPIEREYTARTEARNEVEIRARVEGFLESIDFEDGKPVKAGAQLFKLDSRLYEANAKTAQARLRKAKADLQVAREQVSVRAAEAAVEQAQARLRKAKEDVARLRPLAEQDAVPKQDLDTALAQQDVAVAEVKARDADLINSKIRESAGIETAEAAVMAAEADLARAELDIEYCAISSPIDGLAGIHEVSIGNLVGRGEPTLLVTVAEVDPLYVNFSISETEYLAVMERRAAAKAGATRSELEIELILADGKTYEHKGSFQAAQSEVDIRTGTLNLQASFPNPEGLLRPNLFGRVRMVQNTLEGALLIPQRCIIEQQGNKFVLLVGDDRKVALRGVSVGPRVGSDIVIEKGLKPGEWLVFEGHLKARPGTEVIPTDKAMSSEKEGN